MNTKNRLLSLLENFIQGVKFHGIYVSLLIHFHYLRSKYFAKTIRNNKYNFLGMKVEFYDIQSLRNMLFELFGFNSYYFESKNKKPVILDIGANIGDSIIYFKWLYPKSKIFAFEPLLKAYELLQKNIKNNSFKNVTAYNAGLGKSQRTEIIYSDQIGTSTASTIYQNASIAKANSVSKQIIQIKRINEYPEITSLPKIDLLKIDIEGSESELFTDLKPILSITDKTIIEFHLAPKIVVNSFDNIVQILSGQFKELSIIGLYRNSNNTSNTDVFLITAEGRYR